MLMVSMAACQGQGHPDQAVQDGRGPLGACAIAPSPT